MRSARLLFAFIALVGCSSSSSTNLNSMELAIDLSPSDQKALCDWWASQYGGYGGKVVCGGLIADQRGPTDQASCVAGLPEKATSPSCGATVGNYQGCVKDRVANGCTTPLLPMDCNATHSSLCVPANAGTD